MLMRCLGLNHTTAPVQVREQFSVPAHHLAKVNKRILGLSGIEQCVVISTCNRTELYYWTSAPTLAMKELLSFFAGTDAQQFENHFYHHESAHSVTHLARVVSGLDSMVLGETEIFGQVKDAYQAALDAGTTKGEANKLFQLIFRIGKLVRTSTRINMGATSVGSVAVELAEEIFGNLQGAQVLILGAGEMCRITAQAFKLRGAETIFVANRSFERATELAGLIGGSAIRFDDWTQHLDKTDIIIAATAAPHYIITPDLLQDCATTRQSNNRPLFLIDIAVPRDIDPIVATLPFIRLSDIDNLKHIADQSHLSREREINACNVIIEAQIQEYLPQYR